METLYIDNISCNVFLKLIFFNRDKIEIKVLNEQSFFQNIFINILIFFKHKIEVESFFFGDIKDQNGQSLHITARNKASILSLKFSKWIMKNKYVIKNNQYCKESKRIVELFISKRTMFEFEYYTQRIEYIKSKNNYDNKVYFWIRNSLLINELFLKESFNNINLFFVSSIRKKVFYGTKTFFKNSIKKILELFSFLNSNKLKNKYYPLVTLASDEINLNTNNRHFPHWFNNKNNYSTLIVNNQSQKIKLVNKDLVKNNISIINEIKGVPFYLKKGFIKLSDNRDFPIVLISNLNELFSIAKKYYYFLKKVKCKKFLYLEPQYPITDAVQLISDDLKIKTICIQYANLGVIAPLMIPSSDYFLVFSKIYEKVFKWNDLGPKKFQSIGYSFINKDNYKDDIDLKINKEFFVISYFDESVQNYKWGYHSEQKNNEMIEKLANLVLKNQNLLVILKPQFVFNTIEKFNSKIIDKALNSGRLMEVTQGTSRNLITPSQIGKISNLSIAHIGGGTAALEIALNNKRVVVINEGGYITKFDSLYKKGKIMYNSLDEIIKLLPKKLNKEKISIGDWSEIINNFSINHLKSKEFINKIILEK